MNGLDLIVVSLWFLPVVLFIIIPLSITCLWGVVSFLRLLRPVAGQQRSTAIKMRAVSPA